MRAPLGHYLAFLRWRTFVPTFFMAFTGYALSARRPADPAAVAADLALLFVVHSVLLWGGANAFNSSQDRDTGPVNLLPDPPPFPPGLAGFGLALQLAAIPLAALRGWRPAGLVVIANLLSVAYSWRGPRHRRAKEVAGLENLINATGCGLGSIALGYFFTRTSLDFRVVSVGLAFTVAIFGGVPTAQIFQLTPETTHEQARNYTSWLGAGRTLRLGAGLFLAHVLVLAPLAPGWAQLEGSAAGRALWCAWAAFAGLGAAHSWWWSRRPFERPYLRMTRQFGLMMTSQVCWSLAAWIATAR